MAVRYGRPPFGPGLNAELLFEQVVVAVASLLLIEKPGPPEDGGANPEATPPHIPSHRRAHGCTIAA